MVWDDDECDEKLDDEHLLDSTEELRWATIVVAAAVVDKEDMVNKAVVAVDDDAKPWEMDSMEQQPLPCHVEKADMASCEEASSWDCNCRVAASSSEDWACRAVAAVVAAMEIPKLTTTTREHRVVERSDHRDDNKEDIRTWVAVARNILDSPFQDDDVEDEGNRDEVAVEVATAMPLSLQLLPEEGEEEQKLLASSHTTIAAALSMRRVP